MTFLCHATRCLIMLFRQAVALGLIWAICRSDTCLCAGSLMGHSGHIAIGIYRNTGHLQILQMLTIILRGIRLALQSRALDLTVVMAFRVSLICLSPKVRQNMPLFPLIIQRHTLKQDGSPTERIIGHQYAIILSLYLSHYRDLTNYVRVFMCIEWFKKHYHENTVRS